MLQTHHLIIPKTARYHTLGTFSAETQQIWFVCHGYGQPAASLIKYFNCLDQNKHYIVAPEGLSRFYWNGFGGKPVPSWMTSEDRENEIKDYLNYLNSLYFQTLKQVPNWQGKINILGFSQGVATVSRWVANDVVKVNRLICWAGHLAHDIDWTVAHQVYKKLEQCWTVFGTEDQFINEAGRAKICQCLVEHQIPFEQIVFTGKHQMNQTILKKIAEE